MFVNANAASIDGMLKFINGRFCLPFKMKYTSPRQHHISGNYRPTSETPLKWRFARGLIVALVDMLTVNFMKMFVNVNESNINDMLAFVVIRS